MKKILVTAAALFTLPSPAWSNPGVFQLNQACFESGTGCFQGDDPGTATIEISQAGGRFVLTDNIYVNSASLPAGEPLIAVDAALGETGVRIDFNGYRIHYRGTAPGNTDGVFVAGGEAVVTIENGTITGFFDGIRAGIESTLVIREMVLQENVDDGIQAGVGVIEDNVFDNNRYGINALSAGSGLLGDRLMVSSNLFIDNGGEQDAAFGMANTNFCRDNVVAYPAAFNNDFDACTLSGLNLCDDSVCTASASIDSFNEKE